MVTAVKTLEPGELIWLEHLAEQERASDQLRLLQVVHSSDVKKLGRDLKTAMEKHADPYHVRTPVRDDSKVVLAKLAKLRRGKVYG